MLRYSKTLSLALLFSLPAIAMENKDQQLQIVDEANQEAPTTPSELLQTSLLATNYLSSKEDLEKIRTEQEDLTKKMQDLEKKQEAKCEVRNKVLTELLEKKKTKESSLDIAKSSVVKVTADITDLEKKHQTSTDKIAAEKAAIINALIAKADPKIKEAINEKEKKANELNIAKAQKLKELNAQKEKALADQKSLEAEIEKINSTIVPKQQDVAKPKRLFGLW